MKKKGRLKRSKVVNFPQGVDYFAFYEYVEKRTEKLTAVAFAKGGKKLPAVYSRLGSVLCLLERAACCSWGCAGGDHQFEWIAGRIHNLAMGSIRLIRVALYDEAISLIRSIFEIANLLALFAADPSQIETWKGADKKTRLKLYSPSAIRDKIEQLGKCVPMNRSNYQLYSENSVHCVPLHKPNALYFKNQPRLTGWFQDAGVIAATNELAVAVGGAAGIIATILPIPEVVKNEIENAATELVESVGSIFLSTLHEALT